MPIEPLTPNRHLHLIEGILHDIVGVQLIDAAHDDLHIWLLGFREEEELGPREGLETGQAEEGRFENLEAGEGGAGDGGC